MMKCMKSFINRSARKCKANLKNQLTNGTIDYNYVFLIESFSQLPLSKQTSKSFAKTTQTQLYSKNKEVLSWE